MHVMVVNTTCYMYTPIHTLIPERLLTWGKVFLADVLINQRTNGPVNTHLTIGLVLLLL